MVLRRTMVTFKLREVRFVFCEYSVETHLATIEPNKIEKQGLLFLGFEFESKIDFVVGSYVVRINQEEIMIVMIRGP